MNRILPYIIVWGTGVLLLGSTVGFALWLSYTGTQTTPLSYTTSNRDLQSATPKECLPQEGYTQQSWIEHMNHHPEQYQYCLSFYTP